MIAAMILFLTVIGALLGTHVFCIYGESTSLRTNNPGPTSLPQPPSSGQASEWQRCRNRPANRAKWACEKDNIAFPTVTCIREDMRTCGNIGEIRFFIPSEQIRKRREMISAIDSLLRVLCLRIPSIKM